MKQNQIKSFRREGEKHKKKKERNKQTNKYTNKNNMKDAIKRVGDSEILNSPKLHNNVKKKKKMYEINIENLLLTKKLLGKNRTKQKTTAKNPMKQNQIQS